MINIYIYIYGSALVSGGLENHISSNMFVQWPIIFKLIMQLLYTTFQNHMSGNVSA